MADIAKLVGAPADVTSQAWNRWIPTAILRFAIDSAVNASRKGVTGGKKAYRIVQERITKERPSSNTYVDEKKPENHKAVGETYTKMGNVSIKQQTLVSAESIVGSEPMKRTPEEDIKELDLPKPRRIFIRSRL